MFDLTGKVALITGSSRGIGKSIAMQMALSGAKVVISSRKSEACEKLNKIKKLESLHVTYHLAYILQIQAGCIDKEAPYVPELVVPVQREFNTLKDASLGEVRKQIQAWAQNDVLPVLAAFENKVDPKFAGVKAVGKVLTGLDVKGEPDIVALTEGNTNYWRAIMEMTAGNQLISTSKIFMHVAVGEFDYANMYLEILNYFADPKTVSGHFLKELKWRMDIFQEELTAQINGGIMMHDANKYQPAIKTYERILMDYPNSAWALYELYFARNSSKLYLDPNEVDDRSDWDAAKKEIFKANPLYSLDVRASTGREGYLMMRRASISTLFKKEEEFDRDFVKYADIALDLGVYGFAAHLYWLTMLSRPKEEYEGRDLLSYFLYCLDKIGDKDIKKNFKGDFDKSFAEITGERRKLMEASPTYKAFEKQE